ncbi:MAG: PhnD/SsuA/transferrin family substrate-binding protein [Nitratireductor sp.]
MSSFAALQMYDLPEVSKAWDRFWAVIRNGLVQRGIRCEQELRRPFDYHQPWSDPQLILGQTCGWPFVSGVRQDNTVLGVFDFGLDTPLPGDYYSFFIVSPELAGISAADLLANPHITIAVNSLRSQSGYRVLGELADQPLILTKNRHFDSGGHRASLRAVAAGEAQLAAIDGVTWKLLTRHDPAVEKVAILGRSRPAPALPLICSNAHSGHSGLLQEIVADAVSTMDADDRHALMLRGFIPATASRYDELLLPPYGNLCFA